MSANVKWKYIYAMHIVFLYKLLFFSGIPSVRCTIYKCWDPNNQTIFTKILCFIQRQFKWNATHVCLANVRGNSVAPVLWWKNESNKELDRTRCSCFRWRELTNSQRVAPDYRFRTFYLWNISVAGLDFDDIAHICFAISYQFSSIIWDLNVYLSAWGRTCPINAILNVIDIFA